MTMFAKVRLYLTASRTALVAEGDERAAFLFAAPGDEIPASAAERFGLVNGNLPDGYVLGDTDRTDAILRAAAMGAFGDVVIADLTFSNKFRLFAKGDIDIAQLLEMVKSPLLVVEALQFVDDEAKQWGPIPGGADFIAQLELLVAAARSIGASMPLLGDEPSIEIVAALDAAENARIAANTADDLRGAAAATASADTPANDPPPVDTAAPVTPPVTGDVAPVPPVTKETPVTDNEAAKEKPAAENKEAKRPVSNKGGKAVEAKD